jgi:hypothetical protein
LSFLSGSQNKRTPPFYFVFLAWPSTELHSKQPQKNKKKTHKQFRGPQPRKSKSQKQSFELNELSRIRKKNCKNLTLLLKEQTKPIKNHNPKDIGFGRWLLTDSGSGVWRWIR